MGKAAASSSSKAAGKGGGITTVLLVCGLPGSGKSTFSATLAGKGWARVSQDDLGTQAECTKQLEKCLKHEKSVIVDRCCVTPSERKTWARRARASDIKDTKLRIEAVYLDVPPDLCKHRVRTRKGHPTLGPGSEDVVDEFCRGLKKPEKWEGPYDACFTATCDADLATLKQRYADPKGIDASKTPAGEGSWPAPPADASATAAASSSSRGTGGCAAYFVRHGERADRVGHTVDNPDDCEITSAGKHQARQAGEFIAGDTATRVAAVYTSPFVRCVQTAADIAGQVGVPNLRVEPGLSELMAERLFHTEPRLNRPSATLRAIEAAGIGFDMSVPPVAPAIPVWPEKVREAGARVTQTVQALLKRHPNEVIVVVLHAHGLTSASGAIPKSSPGGNVNPRPDYCAMTYVDRGGSARMVTDVGYRGFASGTHMSEFMGQPVAPPHAAGKFSTTWKWEAGQQAVAAAAAAAPSPPPPLAAAAEGGGEDDESGTLRSILSQPIEDVLERHDTFRRFFEKGSQAQQQQLRDLWGTPDEKLAQKLRQGIALGWFDTEADPNTSSAAPAPLSADVVTLDLAATPAADPAGQAAGVAAAIAAARPTPNAVCLLNVTRPALDAVRGSLEGDAGCLSRAQFACSADVSPPPTSGRFHVTYASRRLDPQTQVSVLPGPAGARLPPVVFTTLHCRNSSAVLCNASVASTPAARQVSEMLGGCAKSLGFGTSLLYTVSAESGAGVHAPAGFDPISGSIHAAVPGGESPTPPPAPRPVAGGLVGEVVSFRPPPPQACSADSGSPASGSALFVKFPRTQHAYSMGPGIQGDDLLLSTADATALLHSGVPVTVEEKIDGSNLGLWFDADANITCANRGKVVTPASGSQWGKLAGWIEEHRDELFTLLGTRRVLYGEWMVARHSVRYNMLPAYFIAFDVYDRRAKSFLSADRRNALLADSSIPVIPCVYHGLLQDRDAVEALLAMQSSFSDEVMEGVYLRVDTPDGMWLHRRAKVVNAAFLEGIEEGHWQKRVMEKNTLLHG